MYSVGNTAGSPSQGENPYRCTYLTVNIVGAGWLRATTDWASLRERCSCAGWPRPAQDRPCAASSLLAVRTRVSSLKGTVSRDFLVLVFFMNQFPPHSRVLHLDRFEFFRKFAEIFASQGAPPVSATPAANFTPFLLALLIPVANLPPVSTIPAENLPPVSTTPVANGHRYQQHRRQICHRCQ
jgi:hypothetical protein